MRSTTAMAVKTPRTAVGIVRTVVLLVITSVIAKSLRLRENIPATRSICGWPYQRP